MIDTVTVYRQGARVRRAVTIEPGATEVKLSRLPLALDDASVRVRIVGDGVRAALVRLGVEVPDDDPALLPPRDEELHAAEHAVDALRVEVERIERTCARWGALTVRTRPRPKRGEKPAAIPVDARAALARLQSEEAERLATELAARKVDLRRAERTHAELADRDRRATTARNARDNELAKSALIRLDGRAERATLLFEYLVPGACWSPSYTVWLEDGERARIAMRAVVAQRSGEDWRGAKLVLSTADPERWTELPELAKLRIGRAQPRARKRAYREPPEGAQALYADYDAAFGAPQEAALAVSPGAFEELAELSTDAAGTTAVSFEAAYGTTASPPAAAGRPRISSRAALPGGAVWAPAFAASPPPAPSVSVPSPPAASMPMGGVRMQSHDVVMQAAAPRAARAPTTFELDVEAMAYGRLRMCGPDSARRGELAVFAAADLYAEGLAVAVDVGVAIRVAVAHASVDGALPAGHVPPAAPDAFDYAYAADVPADVPSDGAFHAVPVVIWDVPAKVRHVAVPREASDVFRLLEVEGPDAALLDGPADVYEKKGVDYTYVLTGRVRPTAPSARLSLGLGVEQSIKIARNATFTEESTGLLGGRLALVHAIAIDLKNNLSRAAEIEVRERIPIQRTDDDDVTIELGSVEPAWKAWDQDDSLVGGRVWTLRLGAGDEATLRARYTVRIAAKHQLAGGNRRES